MELKKKVFTTAPLPFMGQKRKFLKQFKPALNKYSESATYVDLFGGSGLLSHTVKSIYPGAKVVYNDFDNYRIRLENIGKTNQLIADLRVILNDSPKDKIILGEFRSKVLERVLLEENSGYVDYITLSSSILFSMKYALSFEALQKETLYNNIRQSEYTADGYLDGLEVVSLCYKELFAKYKDLPNVVFLVDPPYLSTESGTYKSFWKLRDYLDVLQVLDGTKYFYFTSKKSSIIELCEWIETKMPMSNPFTGASLETMNATVTYQSSYTDIMLYKYE
ncbi:DNA adenine methylase [Flavobacterium psychrophilum]|uniref:DNA adenine methylase n=1 Tax=Flavobacterium psychrophilum TaxID=96345 RepID=UPI000B7C0D81|nr:DNA adenine methylase [Flavobacterium psychrophilum]EKT3963258.1 DNA adenine methylase [Flavobacterium psychrophilum]EKT4516713.1 DNA adenine methylase [Flavobacterium psychrophilum]SNA73446.1 D12 class N6 adenine-specific DNA methyltransferase [Flavobacterium psychrophilum]